MKGFLVFLTLALAASATANTVSAPKNIIDDAIALKICLDNAVATIQGSVAQLLNTVNDVQEVLTSNIAKLKACMAIGGDNPTAIQQIQQATCLVNLASTVQNDINTVVNNVQTSINNLAGAGNLISACLNPEIIENHADKNIIDDAIALKDCVEKAIATIQESVDTLLHTLQAIQAVIDNNVAKLRECQALGAGGSIIDQLQEATCILGLVDSIKLDVAELINNVQTSIDNLIHVGDLLGACF